jgi:hypothetical protein
VCATRKQWGEQFGPNAFNDAMAVRRGKKKINQLTNDGERYLTDFHHSRLRHRIHLQPLKPEKQAKTQTYITDISYYIIFLVLLYVFNQEAKAIAQCFTTVSKQYILG